MDINWPSGVEKNCSSWYNYFTSYDNLTKHDIINNDEFDEVICRAGGLGSEQRAAVPLVIETFRG